MYKLILGLIFTLALSLVHTVNAQNFSDRISLSVCILENRRTPEFSSCESIDSVDIENFAKLYAHFEAKQLLPLQDRISLSLSIRWTVYTHSGDPKIIKHRHSDAGTVYDIWRGNDSTVRRSPVRVWRENDYEYVEFSVHADRGGVDREQIYLHRTYIEHD